MKLSSRARHAVRLALEVARNGNQDEPVRLVEIAKKTGLSRGFLEQLACTLKSHSLLRGVCGRNGGYLLARSAGEITIGDVLHAVIGPLELSVCTLDDNTCMSSDFCECRLVWLLLQKRMTEILSEFTLADILDKDWMDTIRNQLKTKSSRELVSSLDA